MLLIIDTASARVLARYTTWAVAGSAFAARAVEAAAANHGLTPEALSAYTVEDPDLAQALDQANLTDIQVAVESGQVTGVSVAPPNNVWLHVAVSGGDGEDPPGIVNDGSDALTITATLRATADPASPKIEVDGAWRITIRDDAGASYDMVKVQMTAGVVSASYAATARPAVCELLESDFDPVTAGGKTYTVRLAAPVGWKVYRNL